MEVMLGAIILGSALVGLFFLRFWRASGDRFFLYFALSFFVEALNRLLMVLSGPADEAGLIYYMTRLLSYGMILWAILEKNWPRRPR